MSALVYFKNRFAEQYLYILLFCTLFMIVGYYAPRIYAQMNEYYRLTQPVSIDRKLYNKCDTMNLTTTREATTDLKIAITHQLVRVEKDGRMKKSIVIKREAVVQQGKTVVSYNLTVPCDAPEGVYFWTANIHYSVEGVEKDYSSTSEQFTVVDEPTKKVE